MLCSIFVCNLEEAAKHHCLVSILSQTKIGMIIKKRWAEIQKLRDLNSRWQERQHKSKEQENQMDYFHKVTLGK